jgi:ribosomal protein L31E
MAIDTVHAGDWVSLAVGIVGVLTAALAQKDRLPSWVRKWLQRIGTRRIIRAIEFAGSAVELTPDQRRARAVAYLQEMVSKEFGFSVPTSIANLLVEHIYQQWKKLKRKRLRWRILKC